MRTVLVCALLVAARASRVRRDAAPHVAAPVAAALGVARARAAINLPVGQYQLSPVSQPTLGLRHCNYQAFATPIEAGNDDFNFLAVAALNGVSGQVSFESLNYPGMFLAPVGKVGEAGRLGIVDSPDANNASYTPVAGLSDPTKISLISSSTTPALAGKYVALGTSLSGQCAGNYNPPSADVYLADPSVVGNAVATWSGAYSPPPPPPYAIIDASNVTHRVSPLIRGCHVDVGYTNQPVGFRANLVYGESFESAPGSSWNAVQSGGGAGTAARDPATPFGAAALPSMKVTVSTAGGVVGVSNRGLSNEGFSITGGREYTGHVYVSVPAGSGNVSLVVQINDYTAGTTLAAFTASVGPAPGGGFSRVEWAFTPSAGTTCVGIAPGSDPAIDCGGQGDEPGHICVRCGGEVVVGLAGPAGAVANFGYVWVGPGAWALWRGQPVLASAVETLQTMGVTMIRQGGTVSQSIAWKDWRGPPHERKSLGHVWGASLVSGWGPFEFFNMCESAGIEPVITFAYDLNSAADWADLVSGGGGVVPLGWAGRAHEATLVAQSVGEVAGTGGRPGRRTLPALPHRPRPPRPALLPRRSSTCTPTTRRRGAHCASRTATPCRTRQRCLRCV